MDAPAEARRALSGLASRVDADVLERLGLVVSEVITNCVRHAGLRSSQPIEMQVSLVPSLLRVEVTDDGPGFEAEASRPDIQDQVGGWGLWLVESLADRWGVEPGGGTRVWCEFDSP